MISYVFDKYSDLVFEIEEHEFTRTIRSSAGLEITWLRYNAQPKGLCDLCNTIFYDFTSVRIDDGPSS